MTSRSWGRYPAAAAAAEHPWRDRHALLPAGAAPLLAFGMGRSYGDVALNAGGTLLLTRGLDRFIDLDSATGVLRAEAGVTLDEILRIAVPRGWFLAVTPGTRYVTLGGAVANDVHGKNHHTAGSFGNSVRALELLGSNGLRRVCSPTEEAALFSATVAGLGLTGLITWVEIQLQRIPGPWLNVEHRRFRSLDGYWELDEELGPRHAHAVAWIDAGEGRGIYSTADFTTDGGRAPRNRSFSVRVAPPVSVVTPATVRAFNALYWRRPLPAQETMHWSSYFYPLDAVLHWNRLYGRKGFVQYQCLLPHATAKDSLACLLRVMRRSRQGSFLAVLKTMGDRAPVGMLSFCRPGVTLAVDFPMRGERTLRLLQEFDAVVRAAGGALYPAKDARMSPEMFAASFPRLREFLPHRDPAFSSSFWRRVYDSHC